MIKKEEIIIGTKEELEEYFSQFTTTSSLVSISEQLDDILEESSNERITISMVFYLTKEKSDDPHILNYVFQSKYVRIITPSELETKAKTISEIENLQSKQSSINN